MTDEVSQAGGPLVEPLTRRERQVLALLAEGYSGPEIAEKLTLALSSVKSHIQHVYGKPYGIALSASEWGGLRVTVTIPLIRDDKEGITLAPYNP